MTAESIPVTAALAGVPWEPGASKPDAILSFTDVALRQGVDNGHIPEWLMTGTQVGQVRFMLIGLGLILLAAFRPQGIFGNKEEMALDDR